MKKQPHITAITRQNIVDAFWALYKQRPLDQITIKDIMVKAGYNRGTFYEYFDNVRAVLDHIEDGLIEYMQSWITSDPSFWEKSDETIGKIAEMYRIKGEFFGILLGENGDPHFPIKWKAAMKPLLVSALNNSGETSLQQDLALEYSISGILALVAYWYPLRDQFGYEQLAPLMRSLLNRDTIQNF